MTDTRKTQLLIIFALLLFGSLVHAKGADGIVTLKGVVHHAVDSGDRVAFEFTGELSFVFFTAARSDAGRRQIDLKFDVRDLRVEVPAFGDERGISTNPFIVNFANAAYHSVKASETGEPVTIALFNPMLSFNISGVIEKASCTHAQVMLESVERQLRQ